MKEVSLSLLSSLTEFREGAPREHLQGKVISTDILCSLRSSWRALGAAVKVVQCTHGPYTRGEFLHAEIDSDVEKVKYHHASHRSFT